MEVELAINEYLQFNLVLCSNRFMNRVLLFMQSQSGIINSSCMVVIVFLFFYFFNYWTRLYVLKPLYCKYYSQCLIVYWCSTGTWRTVRKQNQAPRLSFIGMGYLQDNYEPKDQRKLMTSIRTLFQMLAFENRWSCESENNTFCLNSVWPALCNLRQLLRQIMGRWRFIRLSTLHLLYTRTKEEIPDLQGASFLVNNCWRDTRVHKLLLHARQYPRQDELYPGK